MSKTLKRVVAVFSLVLLLLPSFLGVIGSISKVKASSDLLFSTYFGGNFADFIQDTAVDSSGNIYIVGNTQSTNLTVLNPVQGNLAGNQDVFVAKFSQQGSLVYSTYLGGSGFDEGASIAVDNQGRRNDNQRDKTNLSLSKMDQPTKARNVSDHLTDY